MVPEGSNDEQSDYYVKECEEFWTKSDKTVKSALAAMKYIEKAIELNPINHRAWGDKGFLLKQLGELETALLCINKAISIKADYTVAWYNKGVILGLMGKFREAIACYNETLKFDPNHIYAKRDLEVLLNIKNIK